MENILVCVVVWGKAFYSRQIGKKAKGERNGQRRRERGGKWRGEKIGLWYGVVGRDTHPSTSFGGGVVLVQHFVVQYNLMPHTMAPALAITDLYSNSRFLRSSIDGSLTQRLSSNPSRLFCFFVSIRPKQRKRRQQALSRGGIRPSDAASLSRGLVLSGPARSLPRRPSEGAGGDGGGDDGELVVVQSSCCFSEKLFCCSLCFRCSSLSSPPPRCRRALAGVVIWLAFPTGGDGGDLLGMMLILSSCRRRYAELARRTARKQNWGIGSVFPSFALIVCLALLPVRPSRTRCWLAFAVSYIYC